MPTTTRIHAVSVYRSIPRSTERYMEERLWQRALARLEGPARSQPKKKRSFAKVLRAVRGKFSRHVDIYV